MYENPQEAPKSNGRRRVLTLLTLSLVAIAVTVLVSLVLPTLPLLQQELGIEPSLAGSALVASTLAGVVTTPLAGRLADLFGARRALLTVIVAVILGGYMSAYASSFEIFLIGQILLGCGLGIVPVLFVALTSAFEPSQMKVATGILVGVMAAGEGLGILLAGPVALSLSRAAMFAIPTTALAAAGLLFWLGRVAIDDVRAPSIRTLPWLGAVLLGSGLLSLFGGINLGPETGWLAVPTLVMLGGGLALLTIWYMTERRANHPLVGVAVLGARGVWAPMLVAGAAGAAISAAAFLMLQRIVLPSETGVGLGADVAVTSLYLFYAAAAGVVAAPIAGRIAGMIGSAGVAVAGCALLAIGAIWLCLFTGPFEVIAGLVLLGIGSTTATCAAYAGTTLSAPPEHVGIATALVALARTFGSAVGTQIGALALAGGVTTSAAFSYGLLAAAAVAVGGIAASLFVPRDRDATQRPTEVAHV